MRRLLTTTENMHQANFEVKDDIASTCVNLCGREGHVVNAARLDVDAVLDKKKRKFRSLT